MRLLKVFLLACLVALPIQAMAACASGTLDYWTLDGTNAATCGSDVMSLYSGGPNYVSSPSPPSPNSQWPGTFANNNGAYYCTANITGFDSTTGSKNYIVDFSDVTTGYVLDNEYVDSAVWLQLYTYSGSLYIQSDPLSINTAVTTVSTGTTYYIIENWSSAGITIYMGTSSGSLSQVYSESTPLPSEVSTDRAAIGVSWQTGYVFDGYIAQYRISDVTRTTWPVDSANTPTYTLTSTLTTTPTYTYTAAPTPTAIATGVIQYSLVGGGGSGGGNVGGGGAAGGVTTGVMTTSSAISINIGPGGLGDVNDGNPGTDSTIVSNSITYADAVGGGKGGEYSICGGPGGSGGGDGSTSTGCSGTNTGVSGQGYAGGSGYSSGGPGGGGGQAGVGQDGTLTQGGNGGGPFEDPLSGQECGCGGGAGGYSPSSIAHGNGGCSGGGNGADTVNGNGQNASEPGCGGGGAGGGGTGMSGAGDSGFASLAMCQCDGLWTCGTCTVLSLGDNYVYEFYGNDTLAPPGDPSTATTTFTPTPSFSMTYTPWPTPSPAETAALCVTPPYGGGVGTLFVQNPTPALTALPGGFEQGCVLEPNVLLGPDGLYHMTYSANAFALGDLPEVIGMATAPNPEATWTRYGSNPVVGSGYGGVDYASMSFQLHYGAEWRVYFKNGASGNVDYCTSTDDYNFTYVGTAIAVGSLNPPCTGTPVDFDGCGIFYVAPDYYAIAEVQVAGYDSVCPGPGGNPTYVLWLYKNTVTGSPDSFSPASNIPLDMSGGEDAGGRANFEVNGNYYTFPHLGYPTIMTVNKSNDLYNWVGPSVIATPYPTLWGLADCNQTADASVVTYNGNVYLYYDGTDNADGTGAIGYSKYTGTEAQLDACLMPSITPTFTNVPTATITPSITSTFTASPTVTNTPTITQTVTMTPYPTFTISPTFSVSPTFTSTPTTYTGSTPTNTPNWTHTPTPTPSPNYTATPVPPSSQGSLFLQGILDRWCCTQ